MSAKTLRFDRGTLLFDGYSKDDSPTPICRWDNRVGRFRSWGYHYKNVQGKGEWRDEVQKLLPRTQSKMRPTLRPYQCNGLVSWKDSDYAGIIALPTGSGKTILAVETMYPLSGARIAENFSA